MFSPEENFQPEPASNELDELVDPNQSVMSSQGNSTSNELNQNASNAVPLDKSPLATANASASAPGSGSATATAAAAGPDTAAIPATVAAPATPAGLAPPTGPATVTEPATLTESATATESATVTEPDSVTEPASVPAPASVTAPATAPPSISTGAKRRTKASQKRDDRRRADLVDMKSKATLPDRFKDRADEELVDIQRKLLKKLDTRMTLVHSLYFFMCILTRSAIGDAKVGGLQPDIGINNHQFNTGMVVFYLAYILLQLPSNMYLKRLKPSIYFPVVVMTWAGLTVATAFIHNFGELLALRFLVGFTQAPMFPGAFFHITCWYRKEELPMRSAYLYGGVILSQGIDSLVAAPILKSLNGAAGLHAWRWLFIIEGAATFFLGFFTFKIMPNMPEDTTWLTADEKAMAIWRVDADACEADKDDGQTIMQGIKAALTDRKLYVVTIMCMMISTAASFGVFLPAIMKSMLYGQDAINRDSPDDNFRTLLYITPTYICAFFSALAAARSVVVKGNRCLHMICLLTVSLIGSILIFTVEPFWVRYLGFYLLNSGLMSCYNLVGAITASSLPRPRMKRCAAVAIANFMGGGVTNFYSSYFFPDSSAPMYVMGGAAVAASHVVCIICTIYIYFYLGKQNRELEEKEAIEKMEKGFRYPL